MRGLNGTPLKDALAKLEAIQAVEASLFEDYRQTYWTKKPGIIALYPGVKPMLEELYSRGVKLGIVTQKTRSFEINGYSAGAIRELEELGVARLFSAIVGFEDVSRYKPEPDAVNLALRHLNKQPRETLMVGDSSADIEAATAAGCWSCYATWGLPAAEQGLGNTQAHFTAETPEALLKMLKP